MLTTSGHAAERSDGIAVQERFPAALATESGTVSVAHQRFGVDRQSLVAGLRSIYHKLVE